MSQARVTDSSSEYDSEELDSDKELQLAFSKGLIKPGLTRVKEPKRASINNVAGLQEKLLVLHNKLDWLERLDITCPVQHTRAEKDNEDLDTEFDVHDDFKREMAFYNEALASAQSGQQKMEQLGVAVRRPDDYFAEMVKTDDHMKKVRENLLKKHKVVESRENMRKLRSLKKFGKQVKQDILEKRRLEKKKTLESIKKYRKMGGIKPDFLREEDDEFEVSTTAEEKVTKKPRGKPSKKRQYKDKKYGFGGKKDKRNTADSAKDMSSFNPWKHSKVRPTKKNKGKKPKRPGKSRRTKFNKKK